MRRGFLFVGFVLALTVSGRCPTVGTDPSNCPITTVTVDGLKEFFSNNAWSFGEARAAECLPNAF
jgi:hypothetical protein